MLFAVWIYQVRFCPVYGPFGTLNLPLRVGAMDFQEHGGLRGKQTDTIHEWTIVLIDGLERPWDPTHFFGSQKR